jgi:hypothetical protein
LHRVSVLGLVYPVTLSDIEARLDRFVPSSLSAGAWAAAREVSIAAVLGTDPVDPLRAQVHLSVLCGFLASRSAWDQTVPPDLSQLLTSEAIATYAPAVSGATPNQYRTKLRRIGTAVGAIEPSVNRAPQPKIGPSAVSLSFWPLVGDLAPFVTLCAVYGRFWGTFAKTTWRGHSGLALDLAPLIDLNQPGAIQVSAAAEMRATLAYVQTAGVALRGVSTVRPNLAAPQAEVRTRASGPVPAKPLSRTAALRAAEEQSVPDSGPQVAEVPPIDEEVAAALTAYRSFVVVGETWARVADVTRLLVTASRPSTINVARARASTMARFAAWVLTRPEREESDTALAPCELLTHGLLDAYLAGPKAGAPDSSRANIQSMIRSALRAISTEPQPPRIAHTPIQAPYSPSECAAFVRLARNQPTSSRRRSLSSVVGLALGGGLDGHDQRGVTPDHCFDVDLGDGVVGLAVTLTGRRARTVVIAAEYEDLLREAIELHFAERRKPDQPLYGDTTDRRNVTSGPRRGAITAEGLGVDVSVARLRTTWLLAAMCADVPLGALLGAAGLQSSRTLMDLLPDGPDPEPEAIDQMLFALRARDIVPPERSAARGAASKSSGPAVEVPS